MNTKAPLPYRTDPESMDNQYMKATLNLAFRGLSTILHTVGFRNFNMTPESFILECDPEVASLLPAGSTDSIQPTASLDFNDFDLLKQHLNIHSHIPLHLLQCAISYPGSCVGLSATYTDLLVDSKLHPDVLAILRRVSANPLFAQPLLVSMSFFRVMMTYFLIF
jgi:hypothetical protein